MAPWSSDRTRSLMGAEGYSAGMTATAAQEVADAITALDQLDEPARTVGKTVRNAVPAGPVKDALSGTWLGHALHPVLTDLPIGTWTSAVLLDWLGGEASGDAADRLVALGIAFALPAAATGITEWADAEPASDEVRRVGVVHAAANTGALALFGASLAARRSGSRGAGKLLALAGAGVMTASGFLGGHLSFAKGVGVDQTAFEEAPPEWTRASRATPRSPAWACWSRATKAACTRSRTAACTAVGRSTRASSPAAASLARSTAPRTGSPTAASCAAPRRTSSRSGRSAC